MNEDKMENSPWLWANEEVGCNSKKLKKSQEEWQQNLAEIERVLWFEQSSRIFATSNIKRCSCSQFKPLYIWNQIAL